MCQVGVYEDDGATGGEINDRNVVSLKHTAHFFWHTEMYQFGKLISQIANCFVHSAYIDTELTSDFWAGQLDVFVSEEIDNLYLLTASKVHIVKNKSALDWLIQKRMIICSKTI